jgi:hypothetical protein
MAVREVSITSLTFPVFRREDATWKSVGAISSCSSIYFRKAAVIFEILSRSGEFSEIVPSVSDGVRLLDYLAISGFAFLRVSQTAQR